MSNRGIAAFALLLLTVLPRVVAGDGATEIWAPTTITESGRYTLTRDIVHPGQILIIDGHDIHLDLNGFRLEKVGTLHYAIVIEEGSRAITIENGVISGGFSIDTNVSRLTIRNTTIKGFFLSYGPLYDSLFEDNVVLTSGGAGPGFHFNGSIIRGNVFRDETGQGIGIAEPGNLIMGNVFERSTSHGLVLRSNHNLIINNLFTGNGAFGLVLLGHENVLRGNAARGNAGIDCAGVGTTDLCDRGVGNTFTGDNYMPNQM
jgi:parallel beta-helix repeat protein